MMKKIAVIGSTGSIGKSTLDVARHLGDSVRVTALAAHSNIELLQEQILEFRPEVVAVFDEKKAKILKERVSGVKVLSGKEGLEEIVSYDAVEFVVMAIVGLDALAP